MNIKPCCEGCGKPYAEAKAIHPTEQNSEAWLCIECAAEQAQVHQFDPEAKRGIDADRESLTNGEYAERGDNTVCDYSGVCNPDDFNIADLITDICHFCDREGHNIRAIIRRAIGNWEGER
jgi:hypothetical protein